VSNSGTPPPGEDYPVYGPRVAAAGAPGRFAVIWEGASPDDAHGIYARAFANSE
jgi:hypothetical protein